MRDTNLQNKECSEMHSGSLISNNVIIQNAPLIHMKYIPYFKGFLEIEIEVYHLVFCLFTGQFSDEQDL